MNDEKSIKSFEHVPGKGLSLWKTAFFLIGKMAGTGILTLPNALANTGWGGVALFLFCWVNALYAGICLGRCWTILEERYEEYRVRNRHPYPCIAHRAVGLKMRYCVSVILQITLLGVSVVDLLLTSELIAKFFSQWGLSFCYWILILAAILCPLMWLGTPQDFWIAAVMAVVSTAGASFLLIIAISKDSLESKTETPTYPPPTLLSFFLSFGTIIYSLGGAKCFPTFQNDMKDRTQFPVAAVISFIALFIILFPLAVLGYAVYGDKLVPDVTESLPNSVYKSMVMILVALHSFFSFLLAVNVPSQMWEEILNIPHHFNWKRVSLRITILLFVLFLSLSVPRFGKILNLVGASCNTLTDSVLPCLFYYLLCSQKSPEWPERVIPTHQKVYLAVIILTGIIGGTISTYSAFFDIINLDKFNPPCYVNVTAASQIEDPFLEVHPKNYFT